MSLVLLTVSEFGYAFGVLVYNIMQLTMRQRVCPPRLLGRMNASIRFVVWGVMPLAALAAGYVGGKLGLVPAMWLGVAVSLLAVVPVLFSPLPGNAQTPGQRGDAPLPREPSGGARRGGAGGTCFAATTSAKRNNDVGPPGTDGAVAFG